MTRAHIARVLAWLACLALLRGTAWPQQIPQDWKGMEIEAKWTIDEATYAELTSAFPEDGERYGHKLNVRWGRVSRLFVDLYYDTQTSSLGEARHSLRHRTRSRSNPRAPDNSLEKLKAASWQEDWQRVQYKSTPCRLGAVWFRVEAGKCKLSDAKGKDLCATQEIKVEAFLNGALPSHPALRLLRSDHPIVEPSDLTPFLEVTDYRYRVELLEDPGGNPAYELSLDRVETRLLSGGQAVPTFEAELELVKSEPTIADVEKLLSLAKQMEIEFSLDASTKSKSGVSVTTCDDN